MKEKKYKLIALTLLIAYALAIMILVVGLSSAYEKEESLENKINNTYATTGLVTKVDFKNDVVTVEDYNGFIWQFSGCEDWLVDDICTMTMDSNGTAEILDDEIVSCRYSGYMEGGWQR